MNKQTKQNETSPSDKPGIALTAMLADRGGNQAVNSDSSTEEKNQKSEVKQDLKYIVRNRLIYGLDRQTYHQLNLLEISYRHAKQKADEKEDMMLAYDEYNDLNNFLNWVEQNIKPISSERDNFDSCESWRVVGSDVSDEELPF